MLEKYKNELAKKKYAPLEKDITNNLVIEFHSTQDATILDKVITTHMRLVLSVINKAFPYETKEDIIMEWISVGNESLMASVAQYKEIEIDFSLYAYYNIRNSIIAYNRVYGNIIRSITTEGKRIIPRFDELPDDMVEEETTIKEFNSSEVIDLLDEMNIKDKAKEMFIFYWGLEDGEKKTLTDCGKHFNTTRENVRQIINRVLGKIKKNEIILKKLSKIMSF